MTTGPRNAPYPLYGDPRGPHHKWIAPEIVWAAPLGGYDTQTVITKWSEPINPTVGLPPATTLGTRIITSLQRRMLSGLPGIAAKLQTDETLTAATFLPSPTPADDDSPRPGWQLTMPRLPLPTSGYSGGWTQKNYNYVEGGSAALADYLLPSKTADTLPDTNSLSAARPNRPSWQISGPAPWIVTPTPTQLTFGWIAPEIPPDSPTMPAPTQIVYTADLIVRDDPPHSLALVVQTPNWLYSITVSRPNQADPPWAAPLPTDPPVAAYSGSVPGSKLGRGRNTITITELKSATTGPHVAAIDCQWPT